MPELPESDPSSAIARALKHALRPLVKLMLAKNITISFITELLKQLMVEVADRDFRIERRNQTDSRISLLTGVHRKDVKRLMALPLDEGEVMPASVSLGAQLVTTWTTTAPFTTRAGQPRKLPRLASSGGEVSFEALVASVSKDIRSRVVLDEWLRLGVAHLEDDEVVLNTASFIPESGAVEKAFYFGHNLHDHGAAATHNVLGGKPPFFERSVHYDALTIGSIETIAQLVDEIGGQAIKAINRRAIELERRDAKSPQPKYRFTYGAYFYNAPMPLAENAKTMAGI